MQLLPSVGKYWRAKEIEISFTTGSLIFLSVMILALPVRWFVGSLIAATVHEMGHLMCLFLLRIPIKSICFSGNGVKITSGNMLWHQEMICSLAGPLAGSVLILMFPFFPEVSVCAFLQSTFNLIPVYPLDGGRFAHSFFVRFLGDEWENRIIWIFKISFTIYMCLLFVIALMNKTVLMTMCVCGLFFFRIFPLDKKWLNDKIIKKQKNRSKYHATL